MTTAIAPTVFLIAFMAAQAADKMPVPFPPIDQRTGGDSSVERPEIDVATNMRTWDGLWQRHRGNISIGNATAPEIDKPPVVNFDQVEVLVIFGGLAPVGGYDVVDSVKQNGKVNLKLQPISLVPNGQRTPAGIRATPYAFIMLPKTKLPINVLMPVKDSNGNMQWKSVGEAGGEQQQGQQPVKQNGGG